MSAPNKIPGNAARIVDVYKRQCLDSLLSLGLLLIGSIGGESSRLAFLLSVETQVLKHRCV